MPARMSTDGYRSRRGLKAAVRKLGDRLASVRSIRASDPTHDRSNDTTTIQNKYTSIVNDRDPVSSRFVLVVSVFAGLLAGFIELFIDIFKKHFYNIYLIMGKHYIWMVPAGTLFTTLSVGLIVAAIARLRPRLVSRAWALWVIVSFAILGPISTAPMRFLACVFLSIGLGRRIASRIARRGDRFEAFALGASIRMIGALLILIAFAFGEPAWRTAIGRAHRRANDSKQPNVLFIVMDTVRAKNLSLYGYRRKTTPELERYARTGAKFENALATAPWTTPSHASMFTGLWPTYTLAGWRKPLERSKTTLAEALNQNGRRTAGFVANTINCGHETGLDRGFERYEDYPVSYSEILRSTSLYKRFVEFMRKRLDMPECLRLPAEYAKYEGIFPWDYKNAERINRDFLDWERSGDDRPFFAFLNYFDAHHPYLTPSGFDRRFGTNPKTRKEKRLLLGWWEIKKDELSREKINFALDSYDDCIAYMDEQIGVLLDELDRRGVLENTWVIVTSDHGEHWGEHGLFGHAASLHREEIHVPLLVLAPRSRDVPAQNAVARGTDAQGSSSRATRIESRSGERSRSATGTTITRPVTLRDLPATIVDLIGLGDAARFPGGSLAGLVTGENPHPPRDARPILSELHHPPDSPANHGESPVFMHGQIQSIIKNTYHYMKFGDGREELYDLSRDPGELTDLSKQGDHKRVLADCRASLDRGLRGGSSDVPSEVDRSIADRDERGLQR